MRGKRRVSAFNDAGGSLEIGEGRGAGPGRDQGRPLLRAERHQWRQERLRAALGALRLDRGAGIGAHQLVVHHAVVAEEQSADRAVADDAGERIHHVLRRGGERDGLDQDQPVVDGLGPEELRQHAEQHVILAGDVDGVAGGVGLVPVAAQHLLPLADHLHPVADLGLRGPLDIILQKRALLLGEGLEHGEGHGALGQAFVHEGDIVGEDGAVIRPPFGGHRGRVEAIQRRLHAAAIGQHRPAPGLVGRVVEIGADHLGQGHGAVADRFHELVGHRDLRRLERRLARPIEDEASARAREQPENHRVFAQNVLPEHLGGVAIELEHHGVECEHILGRGLGRGRGDVAGDRLHVGGQRRGRCLRARSRAQPGEHDGRGGHGEVAFHGRISLHELPPGAWVIPHLSGIFV